MALQVAIDKMRADAGIWKKTSEVLDGASNSASTLTLGKSDLSFVSDEVGLLTIYEKIRSEVERLTAEGSNRTGALAETLLKVADAYQASDANASNLYGGIWNPTR